MIFVWFFTAAAILYIVVAYPLLLARLARARKARRDPARLPAVSIVIAVRDGASFIHRKLRSVLALNYPAALVEVIVVSDGSEDDTDLIVQEYEWRRVKLLRLPRSGKPAALNAGMKQARGDIVVFTDVRQELEPDSLRNLVACFGDADVGVVSGELRIRDSSHPGEQTTGLYWRYERWIRHHLSRTRSVLGATGALYAMRRELLVPIPPQTLLDDVYLPMTAVLKGYRSVMAEDAVVLDVPSRISSEFRRKMRTQAGIYQLMWLLPSAFGLHNPFWIDFWSLKVGRLLLPWLFLLFALTSAALPAPWSLSIAAAQLLFYLLAAADLLFPESSTAKRITSPCRTVVALLAAGLCAIAVLFVPAPKFWRPNLMAPIKLPSGAEIEQRGHAQAAGRY